MASIRKHSSSSSTSLDEIKPWKIIVQIIRTCEGNNRESGNSVDMVLLDSSGTRIHTTIHEAFSKWISDIGNGKINKPNDGETEIDIPEDLLITECKSLTDPDFYQEKAILCHANDVDQINDYMLSQLPGQEKECYSADSISPAHSTPDDDMLYPPEVLNSIKASGLPDFKLRLKVGAPVMLLKDLNPYDGLCKGTRLQITRLETFVLEARIISGNKLGKKVLIPRIISYPTEASYPIKMRRRQFPFNLAFAMAIDESDQVQTLSKVGLYLPRRVFSLGQMYVAISKVKSSAGLEVLITDTEGGCKLIAFTIF
ncbi:PREDICTED: uncharacterized protein LOC104699074 [Camelina sativa]|uniref:Uncharacterized protein LOC104699074 n=1 Tax=Camelina sativa TaxID=90675 RepID=A0ABM1RSB7_CAMSA|nr:PREDICTED: uncharacterized protein LOC104699074 [Camelina sativa]